MSENKDDKHAEIDAAQASLRDGIRRAQALVIEAKLKMGDMEPEPPPAEAEPVPPNPVPD